MDTRLVSKIRQAGISSITASKEYRKALTELAKSIREQCSTAPNEATISSNFDFQIHDFLKAVFDIEYTPTKEQSVDRLLHVSKGRIDSKWGGVIIEYKDRDKLSTQTLQESAISQVCDYINGLNAVDNNDYLGIVTNGLVCATVVFASGAYKFSVFDKLDRNHLQIIIENIIKLNQTGLSSKNLVNDFCSPIDDSVSKTITKRLFKTLTVSSTDKTKMLFDEWKELFSLAHDDISKQQAIIDRRKSLQEVVDDNLSTSQDEYFALFALQTTYAIIVKLVAYKVLSHIRFSSSVTSFKALANLPQNSLQTVMSRLEEGTIFRDYGIGNLLEGDFFSWYASEEQWNEDIALSIKQIVSILCQYEDLSSNGIGISIQDLFKELFMAMIPSKVRHSLGEFYTPQWLADNVVSEALSKVAHKQNWSALDPCSGSGTFITVLIRKKLSECNTLSNKEQLEAVLKNVVGIDLNPLAVLTSRINYFINVAHLITNEDIIEIPIYLGDSSYVPQVVFIDNVSCLEYRIKTLKGPISIVIPENALNDLGLFSKVMTEIEFDIQQCNKSAVSEKLLSLIPESDKNKRIIELVNQLAETFVYLETNHWNGIWARIVTNFMSTAKLGRFDMIVGNPPWIDWKSLPNGYRDKIKDLCISRNLFSGDGVTGGINLNICALISNVAAQRWLKDDGVLAFLMPQSLLFQQSYQGFRNFIVDSNRRLYLQTVSDWTASGHPFKPVQEKFLTYFWKSEKVDYRNGMPISKYVKSPRKSLEDYIHCDSFAKVAGIFQVEQLIIGQVSNNNSNTGFSYATSKTQLKDFQRISYQSDYQGREGIEFYPQEVFLFEYEGSIPSKKLLQVRNIQNPKSKYKIPQDRYVLEQGLLHPLIKGVNIKRYHCDISGIVVPFPYEINSGRTPIPFDKMCSNWPKTAQYFQKFKKVLSSQTSYNDKIIGDKYNSEFYAIARVGDYSFAPWRVAFRDNTKWQACVVGAVSTPWGEDKLPVFQNHAVTIAQDKDGRFISKDEAHYICAILNSDIVYELYMNSSDSRSFPIRPKNYIPKFDVNNSIHLQLASLSKLAHKYYDQPSKLKDIDSKINSLYLKLCDELVMPQSKKLQIVQNVPKKLQYKRFFPIYSLRAACGRFIYNDNVEIDGWIELQDNTKLNENYFIVQAVGESMMPEIHNGDYCLFRNYSEGHSYEGKIVLTQCLDTLSDYDGSYTIKKYHRVKEENVEENRMEAKLLVLSPLNYYGHSDIVIDENPEDYKVIGEFVRVIKSE